ncbi:MAG: STAS domain-containing protein [Ferruginibacter sp.]
MDTAKLLQKKKKALMELWLKNQLKNETLRDDLISSEELITQSSAFLDGFLKALNSSNITDSTSEDFDEVIETLSGLAIERAMKGFSPRETGLFIISLKDSLLQIISQENTDPKELFSESLKISSLMDNFSMIAFETFIKGREEVILRQTDEISEISTPVIRIWDGILALPIIGTLDSARTQVVMENLLEAIVATGSRIAILDISGVPAVDSLVAQHLIKTVSATRLIGAECIISGIRPEIAQTVVHLGIDLSNIITKATLASALKHEFQLLKLEVKKMPTAPFNPLNK